MSLYVRHHSLPGACRDAQYAAQVFTFRPPWPSNDEQRNQEAPSVKFMFSASFPPHRASHSERWWGGSKTCWKFRRKNSRRYCERQPLLSWLTWWWRCSVVISTLSNHLCVCVCVSPVQVCHCDDGTAPVHHWGRVRGQPEGLWTTARYDCCSRNPADTLLN